MNKVLLNEMSIYLDNIIEKYFNNKNEYIDYLFFPVELFNRDKINKMFSDYRKKDIKECFTFIIDTINNNINNFGIDYYRINDKYRNY